MRINAIICILVAPVSSPPVPCLARYAGTSRRVALPAQRSTRSTHAVPTDTQQRIHIFVSAPPGPSASSIRYHSISGYADAASCCDRNFATFADSDVAPAFLITYRATAMRQTGGRSAGAPVLEHRVASGQQPAAGAAAIGCVRQ